MTYQKALQDVRARVAKSRTSFGAGMNVLPRAGREAMYALYAFCREVDDIADGDVEGVVTLEQKRAALDVWRKKIHEVFVHAGFHKREGIPSRLCEDDSSILTVLTPAIPRFGLIENDFQAIIDGMAMDAEAPICAPDMVTLDLYCDHVASAVGRASVRIFGENNANGIRVAHHLGRALQLTNILRDLTEDAARGRLYLPKELLTKHGIASHEPLAVLRDPNLPAVCRDLAVRAKSHYVEANAAMNFCAKKFIRPARIMGAYYGAILDQLVLEDWQDLSKRVNLSKIKKIMLVLRCFFP